MENEQARERYIVAMLSRDIAQKIYEHAQAHGLTLDQVTEKTIIFVNGRRIEPIRLKGFIDALGFVGPD